MIRFNLLKRKKKLKLPEKAKTLQNKVNDQSPIFLKIPNWRAVDASGGIWIASGIGGGNDQVPLIQFEPSRDCQGESRTLSRVVPWASIALTHKSIRVFMNPFQLFSEVKWRLNNWADLFHQGIRSIFRLAERVKRKVGFSGRLKSSFRLGNCQHLRGFPTLLLGRRVMKIEKIPTPLLFPIIIEEKKEKRISFVLFLVYLFLFSKPRVNFCL